MGTERLCSGLGSPVHRWKTAGQLRISMVAQETEDRKPKLATRLLSLLKQSSHPSNPPASPS